MRKVRLLAIAASVALLALFTAGTTASAADGVGTATGSATLLGIDLSGGLVGVEIGNDDGSSNTDPAAGVIEALTSLTPLRISSNAVDALNLTPVSPLEAHSTGDAETDGVEGTAIPANPVIAGTVSPATLEALFDGGPKTGLLSSLADLVIAGLITVPDLGTGLSTHVPATHAISTRDASVDSIDALDLGAILEGLGLPIGALPLDVVGDLLEEIGLSVDGIPAVSAVTSSGDLTTLLAQEGEAEAALDDLDDAVADLLGFDALGVELSDVLVLLGVGDGCDLLTTDLGPVADPVEALLQPVVDAVDSALSDVNDELADAGVGPAECTVLADLVDDVDTLIDELRAVLAGVLGDVGIALDAVELLSFEGIDAGLEAKATDAVDTSVATVEATIGSITVAGETIPGIDLLDTAAIITATAEDITSTLNGILAVVDVGLGDLVDVSLLDITEDISQDGERITSTAALTLAEVTITPPDILGDIVAELDSVVGLGAEITGLGGTVPVLAGAMQNLHDELGTAGAAGTLGDGPSSVEVLGLTNEATFGPLSSTGVPDGGLGGGPGGDETFSPAPSPVPPSAPELPRTGLALQSSMLAGLGLIGAAWAATRMRLRGN